MAEAPTGTRPLSDTDVGDQWVDATRLWKRAFLTVIIAILSITGVGWMFSMSTTLIGLAWAMATGILFTRCIRIISERRFQLDVIALSVGHPWHDAEAMGETTVHVQDLAEQWNALPSGTRLVATADPLLGRTLLRDGDSEGDILVRWIGSADPNIVTLINMAQALSQAQDRAEDADDPFEPARIGEESAEGLLERDWQNTDAGAIEFQPGALLRAFKKSTSGESSPSEEPLPNDSESPTRP
jgi:hypothetical protein